jgi:hypothetical protein
MEKELISKKLLRFSQCDMRFFPYVEKTLMRLPDEICRSFLDDFNFDMVSFGEAWGRFYELPAETKKLIILNEGILKEPEFIIIHTIAHEIAHKIVGKGESGLYEKEAEELLVKWGFQEESEKADYSRTWLESEGYETGYKWAAKQSDLEKFEEFYDEWDKGKLDEERRDQLYYEADVASILYEMGQLNGKIETKTSDDPTGILIPPKTVVDDGSLDRGVIFGIMGYLKKKKKDTLRRLNKSELSEREKDDLFWMTLKEALFACERLFDSRIQLLTWRYAEMHPEIRVFKDHLIEIGELLDRLEKR